MANYNMTDQECLNKHYNKIPNSDYALKVNKIDVIPRCYLNTYIYY